MRYRVFTLAVAGVLLFGTCGFAQDNSQGAASQTESGTKTKHAKRSGATSATEQGMASEKSSNSTVAAADKSFMMKAAEGGLAEVQLGQLAQDKGNNQAVKDFGKQMVDDHGKANDQLKSIAEQKGVTLPTALNAKDKAEKDRLSKLSGEQFDRAYMQLMLKDHTKDVSEFKRESNAAKDNDVKNFASQTLPTLESHLDKAKSVASEVGATGKASAGKTTKSKTSASTSQPQ